jgi:cysteinyl-tRNA synthetase
MHQLTVHNSITRQKESFQPLNPPYVGMYVCGPTVYGEPHLGHAKSYVSFDVIYRYLQHLGYRVRYVQNITDVGHLTDDSDDGEDKIQKQSKVEQLEPMEVVEHYMNAYFYYMDMLNQKRPSITPRPSGHIPEQIQYIQDLINNGWT